MSRAGGEKETDADFVVPPEDWPRAKAVLTAAADLEAKERLRLIQERLADEPKLHNTLLTILAVYDKTKRVVANPAASATAAGEEAVSVGADYGPYRVLRSLGAGGMGQVFLADDLRLGRRVALKSLAGRFLASPTARQQLLREARAAAALSHQNIVTLFDVVEGRDYFLLVMEYVEGRTLADALADAPISVGHALRLLIQTCDAIVYAHDRGIIHCDIKPANVQVSPDGIAKVLDFGLARAKYAWQEFDADGPGSQGLLIGTPPYMPPERLLTGSLNVSGDIYSLGVTLFEVITGRRPFAETDFATLTGAILGTTAPKVSSIVPGCPASLDQVVERALMKDPKQRYQTASEFVRDLRAVLHETDTRIVEVPLPVGQVGRPFLLHTWWRLLAILVMAVFAGLTLVGFLTSTFYNSGLGLPMAFEGESPVLWPIWGIRSLVLPLAQIGYALLVLAILSQVWQIVCASSGPLRRWRDRTLGANFITSLRSMPAVMVAAGLVVAQGTALGLCLWRFSDLIGSFNDFLMHSGSLAALAPSSGDEHKAYVRILSVLLFAFGIGWYRILQVKSRLREQANVTSFAAGIVLMVLTFLLMVIPYRLLFHSDGERVSYESERCYLVGQEGNEARLFCPLQPSSWNRVVNLNDPALKRSGTIETIFSAMNGSEPKNTR